MSVKSPPRNNVPNWRIITFQVIIVAIFGIFGLRLYQLQVLDYDIYLSDAQNNRENTVSLPAPRGNIYDRNGIILASNVPAYNVVITPADLPDDPGDIQEVYRKLSTLTGQPVNLGEINNETPFLPCKSEHGINQIATYGENTAPYRPVRIVCDIDKQVAMIIQEKSLELPGVSIEIESVREYPTGELTAAFIGFLGPIPANQADALEAKGFVVDRDKIGYAGIEYSQQNILTGKNGIREEEIDVAGQLMRVLDLQEPVPGASVALTIDLRLQAAASAIVQRELEGWNEYLGYILSLNAVAIAMDPSTGEILAMVSTPTFENNRFARTVSPYYYIQLSEDESKPFLNHAITAEHPPGSVFKIATAIGALNEGVVTPEQVISTPGSLTIEQKYFSADIGKSQTFYDWNRAGFGQLDFIGGIANSSNVYFYKLGGGYGNEVPEGLGICRLKAYANAIGYGEAWGIELPGEETGLLPDPRWKRINQGENWSTGDTYIAAVGQGYVLATPLQVLLSGVTIANDGVLVKPTIIKEVISAEGVITYTQQTEIIHDLKVDPVVEEYFQFGSGTGSCQPTGNFKTVEPWVFDKVQEGMRQAVLIGTLQEQFKNFNIAAAGKTGTAEYCDPFAQAKNRCTPGNWPTHAWSLAYAPYDNPEIVVVAFVYNGGEGASVAGPIVQQILSAYFEIKALEN